MTEADIKTQCPRCLGTGVETEGNPPVTQPCTGCDGTGYREKDKIDITEIIAEVDDVEETADDILDKVKDLKEKLDETKEVCDKILKIVSK
jgi:DnaJ-class molecular chaperone